MTLNSGVTGSMWENVLSAIGGAIGAAAIIIGAVKWGASGLLSRHLQQQKAALDREMENHKDTLSSLADRRRLRLKREELMFNRELDAALAFNRLLRGITPGYMGPHVDRDDYITVIAELMGKNARQLELFLAEHEIALSAGTEADLVKAYTLAEQTSYEVAEDGTVEGSYPEKVYPSQPVQAAVEEFLLLMNRAKKRLRNDLKDGSFGAD